MRVSARDGFFSGGMKTVATIASTGAAMVSIITFLHAWGIVGDPESRASVGNIGARWIGVRPLVDTATTIHDTIHLAATVTDRNGSILFGARPAWATENPQVATVEQDGSVIARGPGVTTIIAVAGDVSARSHIIVRQAVAAVRIAGDSTIALAEGDTRALAVHAFDARGFVIPPRPARWAVEEGGAVTLDSTGTVTAVDAGRSVVSATLDDVTAQALVVVAPSPAALSLVKGDAQRGRAGRTLADRVIVRVVNHRGRPVEGTLVRFRPVTGVVDPAAVVTDADGRARAAWTLGEVPGPQRLLAAVDRVDSALVVVADAEPVASKARLAALRDSIRLTPGATDTIAARLTDTTGQALADVRVHWQTSDGRVVALGDRTDSSGVARAVWTTARKTATQRVRVASGEVAPASIVATAIVPPKPAEKTNARAPAKHAETRASSRSAATASRRPRAP